MNFDNVSKRLFWRLGGHESEEALTEFAGSKEGAVFALAILLSSLLAAGLRSEGGDEEIIRKALASAISEWAKSAGAGKILMEPEERKGFADLLEREGSPEALGEDLADFAEETGILKDIADGTLRRMIEDGN